MKQLSELQLRRMRLGLSRRQLAEEAGVSESAVSQFEAGARWRNSKAMARVLGTLTYLEQQGAEES